ncbi:hypothetical protein J3458_015134 [Metarhizium acridum]|uniref:uncharacterized protein n=1 Tax=Metarhizium acridum TaxID=92637 RepID=UPI001C6CDECD|nr:hypothetical protein J3458_015134 [Metarhizium acridum]
MVCRHVRARTCRPINHLVRHGGDPNRKQVWCIRILLLGLASSNLDPDSVIRVCDALRSGDRPMQLNMCGPGGATALMIAAEEKSTRLRWLLKNGADFNALDSAGRGALHLAAKAGHAALVQELLEWKPKLDGIDTQSGMTLLQTTLHEPRVVKLLLDAGANPESTNRSGDSLINNAVLGSHRDVVGMLLDRKANTTCSVHHPDGSGRTPHLGSRRPRPGCLPCPAPCRQWGRSERNRLGWPQSASPGPSMATRYH